MQQHRKRIASRFGEKKKEEQESGKSVKISNSPIEKNMSLNPPN